jgi:hypothetical protein
MLTPLILSACLAATPAPEAAAGPELGDRALE